jgi:hypothetical protein
VVDERHRRPALPTGRIVLGLLLTAAVVLVALTARDQRDDGGSGAVTAAADANYLVRPGDTISSVADLHGVSAERLMEENGLTASDPLDPDSRLTIPELSTEGRSPPRELTTDTNKMTYVPLFEQATADHGLPPGLLAALAWHESEWVNVLVDEDERIGLGQLRPDIVSFLRRDVVDEPLDPSRPEDNVTLTAAYLAYLLEASEGDRAAALAGYYMGFETPAGGTWDLDVVRFVNEVLTLAPDFAAPGDTAAARPTTATTGP